MRAWRNARGLERDDDFAFMFLSEEDAYAEGGAALAEAWLEVAGQACERLMPAAVAVAEGPPVGRMLALNPRKGRRAPAPLAVQPDHLAEVLRHVEVLAGALMGFRAMRLSGELTPALKGEWEASCRRRAQHLLTFSDQDPG